MAEALEFMARVRDRFRSAYTRMLETFLERRLSTVVCTIYKPRFPEPERRRLAATARPVLNDAIAREAFVRRIDCIDLRLVCDEDADFAIPIEPSVQGGEKIARAILNAVVADPAHRPRVIAR